MSPEILVLLFILFIVSSLVKRFQEARSKRQLEEEGHGPQSVSPIGRRPDTIEENEIDLSEWEIFPEFERSRPEPEEEKPSEAYSPGEFQEVQGKRPVTETYTGREFQEIQGKRTISEVDTGEEFQEVQGKRTVSETPSKIPTQTLQAAPSDEPLPPMHTGRKRRRIRLDLNRGSLRKAILYAEILGPSRADRMPW